jgi:hypothetical protein
MEREKEILQGNQKKGKNVGRERGLLEELRVTNGVRCESRSKFSECKILENLELQIGLKQSVITRTQISVCMMERGGR